MLKFSGSPRLICKVTSPKLHRCAAPPAHSQRSVLTDSQTAGFVPPPSLPPHTCMPGKKRETMETESPIPGIRRGGRHRWP